MKLDKRHPPLTNPNSSASVIFIVGIAGVVASFFHTAPRFVNWTWVSLWAMSMLGVHRCGDFSLKASATFCPSLLKLAVNHICFCATRASTIPNPVFLAARKLLNVAKTGNKKASERHSGEVFKSESFIHNSTLAQFYYHSNYFLPWVDERAGADLVHK